MYDSYAFFFLTVIIVFALSNIECATKCKALMLWYSKLQIQKQEQDTNSIIRSLPSVKALTDYMSSSTPLKHMSS